MGVICSIIASIMAIAGMAALAGNPFWAKHTSGTRVIEHPIRSTPQSAAVFSLTLDPSMNPLHFTLHGRPTPVNTTSHYAYRGTLSLKRETVMTSTATMTVEATKTKPGVSVNIGTTKEIGVSFGRASVPSAGQYEFTVVASHSAGDPPSGLRVDVTRNANPLPANIMWQGIGLIVAALILQALFGANPKSKPD